MACHLLGRVFTNRLMHQYQSDRGDGKNKTALTRRVMAGIATPIDSESVLHLIYMTELENERLGSVFFSVETVKERRSQISPTPTSFDRRVKRSPPRRKSRIR